MKREDPLTPSPLSANQEDEGSGWCPRAIGSANPQTRVAIVVHLAITEAMGLNRKQFSTRLRTACLTRIVDPYSLFSPSRRAAWFTLLPSTV